MVFRLLNCHAILILLKCKVKRKREEIKLISLNERQIEFIKLLLEEKDYKTISSFAEVLKTSSKTLQKDLAAIEDYLDDFNIMLDRKSGTGIKVEDADRAKLLLINSLQEQEIECKKVSVNERRIEIIKNMLINSHTTTSIQKLSDMYDVSKTSITNDLVHVEKWIAQFNLKLDKNADGTKVKGAEVDIRRAIASLLTEYPKEDDKEGNIKELSARLDAATINALSELFEMDKIIYINILLAELEKKYNCCLDDPYYINLLTHILISLTRGMEGKQIKIDEGEKIDNLKSERAYGEAVTLINKINNDFKINLGESEVYYLYQYFVSSGLVKNVTDNADEVLNKLNQRAELFAEKMTRCMEEILHINILQDEIVMEGLLMHIRPMLNRLNYDIQISNPLMGDIKSEYQGVLNICRAVASMVSHNLKLKAIPIDEIGYLALYYQLALERSIVKKRILVVCFSGYGTSQLLTTRIRRAFPDWEIADTLSVNMLENRKLDDIDFIVSTVPLDVKEKPYILVSAFLSDEDIKNMSRFLIEKPVETSKRETGTLYIDQYLKEDNIFFNQQSGETINKLCKKYSTGVSFQEILLGEDIKVQMGFKSGEPIFAVALNSSLNLKKQIVFYMAMDNIEIMTHLLSEIYHLHTFEACTYYLRKCMKAKDVKNYFGMNKGDMKTMATDLSKVIKVETIELDMKATTKDEVLKELTTLLYNAGLLSDRKAFLDDVYYRESLGSTGIGNGIAIPHGKSKFVNETSLAIGRTHADVTWETLDGKPIRFIILFAVAEKDKSSTHIRLLSQVAAKLSDDEACERLLNTKTPEEIYEIFAED